jgi:hypothetical protein
MLDRFKKSPPRAQLLFRDADKLARNGYLPVPLEFGDSTPNVSPSYAYFDELRHGSMADCGIGIYTGATQHMHEDFAVVEGSWLVTVEIVTSSKAIGKAVDALMSERFPKLPAVRRTDGTHDRLFVFGCGEKLPFPAPSRATRWFQLPRDKGSDRLTYCRVECMGGVLTYSGLSTVGSIAGRNPDGPAFYWERDLIQIRRDDLPSLDYEASSDLWADIENIFEREGAEWVV